MASNNSSVSNLPDDTTGQDADETDTNISQSDNPDSPDSLGKKEDPPADWRIKLKKFGSVHWRGVVCLVTPIIFILILIPFPPEPYQWCAYTLLIMAIYWVSECIPLAVTSFIPMIIFPFSGIMDTNTVCKCYMNDTIIMFIGSLVLAYAVEQSGLHRRLALCVIRTIGYSHYKLLFALIFTTMFVSMWITNTAATTMMVPINFAILSVFEEQKLIKMYEKREDGELIATDITTCYFCSATYAATLGGIGTLVGTATNLVFKGLFIRSYPFAPEYLSFPKFSAFSIPMMIFQTIALYLIMIIVYFGFLRPKSKAAKSAHLTKEGLLAAKLKVLAETKKLGRISFWEVMALILFVAAMILFFCRSPQIFDGWGDKVAAHFRQPDAKFARDSVVAMLISYLMLMLPSTPVLCTTLKAKFYEDLPKTQARSVLDWKIMNDKMPYSFMFLLGGGFALSTAAKKDYTDLNGKIGEILSHLSVLPNFLILFLVILFTMFVTNFASNVAVCNVIAPIAMQLAKEIKQNPLWYNIAAGFCASFTFCIPVGTPGNLIVQSAAKIPTKKMIIAGAGPTVSTLILSFVFIYFWAPVIWSDINELPKWAHQ